MRVVIRARGRGPLGFVRLPLPADGPSGSLTYAAVRKAITEQLAEVMPDEAYVFLLEGGVPVAPSQESAERPAEGTGPGGDDEREELDLLYDGILNCYYDPRTNKYYELA